jgi:predicted Rossmann fold flavoprotein
MYDVIVIGAGAAGLMAAVESGKRGRKTLLIEHTDKIGEKIRISGGGRCNFTNIHASSAQYLSQNPHFAKSALAGYTPQDFIKMIESYGIGYHEKTLGQLFCDISAKQIINMFLDLCQKSGVTIKTSCAVTAVEKTQHFQLQTSHGLLSCQALVIATGGLSIPQIGATDFGHRIAMQFGLNIVPLKPGLVPLTVPQAVLEHFSAISGVSNFSCVSYKKTQFQENILFTHRGLSGPAILQISSYLEDYHNSSITINLLPKESLLEHFKRDKHSKQSVSNYLKNYLSNRFVDNFFSQNDFKKSLTDLSLEQLRQISDAIHRFTITIAGSEGYRKAEVTVGGVDTHELSSKTMACKKVPGLFFIGEVVDVTGWLGGYNFQWAWSSGFAAGQYC